MEQKIIMSPWIVVGNSGIHGKGIYAACDISEGTRVIEYVGEKLTKKESDIRADEQLERAEKNGEGMVYIFELDKEFDVDGNVEWNTARLINHSCNPNCETDIIDGKIWIIALRDIKKGEEITYDYGYDYDDWDEHLCRCGAKNCVGFIVDSKHWSKLKKTEKWKRLREQKS